MAFISGYSVAATAIGEPDLGLLTQTEMIERAGASAERRHPDYRRRRHRLRQSAERLSHGQRADRRRRGRLLPGGPGLAEEVRAHAGQAGRRTGGLRAEDPRGRRKPAARPTSSSSPAPTPWRRWASTRRSPGSRRPARRGPTPASSRPRRRSNCCQEIGRRAEANGGQHDRRRQNAPASQIELAEMGFQLILYPLAACSPRCGPCGFTRSSSPTAPTLGEEPTP